MEESSEQGLVKAPPQPQPESSEVPDPLNVQPEVPSRKRAFDTTTVSSSSESAFYITESPSTTSGSGESQQGSPSVEIPAKKPNYDGHGGESDDSDSTTEDESESLADEDESDVESEEEEEDEEIRLERARKEAADGNESDDSISHYPLDISQVPEKHLEKLKTLKVDYELFKEQGICCNFCGKYIRFINIPDTEEAKTKMLVHIFQDHYPELHDK